MNVDDDGVSIEFEELLILMERLGLVCGEHREMVDREPRQAEEVIHVSRSVRKKREYAKTQSLYYKDKTAALKYITDRANFVEYIAPSREIRQEWKKLFFY